MSKRQLSRSDKDGRMFSGLIDKILGVSGKSNRVLRFEEWRSKRRNNVGASFENLEHRIVLASDLGIDPDGPGAALDGDETAGDVTAEDTAIVINLVPPSLTPLNGAGTINGITVTPDTHGTVISNSDGSVTYTPDSNFSGLSKFTYSLTDDAVAGQVILSVTSTNDAPTQNLPGAPTFVEDSVNNPIAGVSVADVDVGSGNLTTTITSVSGNLDVTASGGASVSGHNSKSLTINGNLVDLNATLASLNYDATIQAAGTDTLTFSTNDNGNSPGPAMTSAANTLTINISGVNDAPTVSLPASHIVSEDAGAAAIPGISVADIDAGADPISVTVSLNEGGQISFTGGTPADTTVSATPAAIATITGPQAGVNALLATLNYKPAANFNGPESLSLTVDDQGNNGSGGALTGFKKFDITVNPVNDAPVLTTPAPGDNNNNRINVVEDVLTTISGVSVTDLDLAETQNGVIDVTVSASIGTVTLDGNTGASVTVSGNETAVNALLAGLQYQGPANDGSSAVTLTVFADDNGNTGLGGSATDNGQIFLRLRSDNDAPVITAPDTSETRIMIQEDGSHSPGITVSDADSGTDDIRVTISVNQGGTLTAPDVFDGTQTGSGSSTVILEGAVENVSTSLAAILYKPAANFRGNEDLTVFANDLGNNGGDNSAKTAQKVVGYTIGSENDAPTFDVNNIGNGTGVLPTVLEDPGAQTVTGLISNMSAGPADEAGQALSFSIASNPANAFSAFTIDAATGTINYTLANSVNGVITVDVTLKDDGGTPGAESPEKDDDVATTKVAALTLNVTAVNDQPDFTLGDVPSVTERTTPRSVTVANLFNVSTFGAADEDALPQTIAELNFSNSSGDLFDVQPSIDMATGNLTYTVGANKSGTALLDVFIKDSGGTENGGVDTSITRTVPIVIGGVNEAPSIGAVSALTTAEDTKGIFPTIDFNDPDSGSANIQLDLAVANGTLNFSSTAGLSFTTLPDADGNVQAVTLPASVVRVTGSLASIDAAFFNDTEVDGDGFNYTPNANYNGSDTLTFALNDLGNSGTGGALTDSASVAISVTPVNDPVVNNAIFPDVNAIEDDPNLLIPLGITPFVGANYFTDPDASDATPEPVGLSISSSNTDLVTATQSFGNLVLDYQAQKSGTAVISVTASDTAGNSSTQTFNVTVGENADVPLVVNPIADQALQEDFASLNFGLDEIPVFFDGDVGFGDAISYSVSVSGPAIVTASIDASDPEKRKLIVNPVADQFSPFDSADPPAMIPSVVTVTATDLAGNSASDEFNITVTSLNDKPVANPDFATTPEDSDGVSIDALANDAPGPATATDEAGQTFSLIGIGTVDESFGTVSIEPGGTSFHYRPNADFSGLASFTYFIIDNGAPPQVSMVGTGDVKLGVVTINVVASNDAPVLQSVPGNLTVNEDSTTSIPGIVVKDVDSATVTVTIALDKAGKASADASGNAVVSAGAGLTTVTGSVADVNATLANLKYTPAADANSKANSLNANETMTVSVNDVEGLPATSMSTEFTILAVNDSPRFNNGLSVSVLEGSGEHKFDASAVAGPADEVADGQSVAFYGLGALSDPAGFLDGAPTINATNGEITFKVKDELIGTATVDVIARDNLGAETVSELTINANGLNLPPVITILGQSPVQRPVNSGSVDVLNFAVISPGPDTGAENGSDFPPGQRLTTININTDNPELFSIQPDFEASSTLTDGEGDQVILGDLTFAVRPGVTGTANAVLTAVDDAGTPFNFTDDLTSSSSFQIIIGTPSNDTDAPHVTGVKVSGSSWTGDFLDAIDAGSSVGYALPTEAAQADPIPWSNLNRIHVQFDEPVFGSGPGGSFTPADFAVTGVNTLATPISSVSYNPGTNTAILNLANALGTDKFTVGASSATVRDDAGNALDGEWENGVSTFDSGDGTAGGDFFFGFNVLVADSNQDGVTNFIDLDALGIAFAAGIGDAEYSMFLDSTGDGNINFFELNDLGLNFGETLPTGGLNATAAAAVDQLFDELEGREVDDDDLLIDAFAGENEEFDAFI